MTVTTADSAFSFIFKFIDPNDNPNAGPEDRTYTLHPDDLMYPVMMFLWTSLAKTEGVKVEGLDPSGGEMSAGYVPIFLLDNAHDALRGSCDAVPGLMRYYGPPVTSDGARAFHFEYSALNDWNVVIQSVLGRMPEAQREAIRANCAKDVFEIFTRHADTLRDAFEHDRVLDLLKVPELNSALRCAFSILPEGRALGLVMCACGMVPDELTAVQ